MKYNFQSLRVCYPYENCLGFRLKQLAVLDLHAYVCINMYAHEPEEMEGRLMIQFAWKLKQSAKSKLCSKLSREVCVVCHYLEGDLTLAPPLVTGWTHWALVLWDGWDDFMVFHLEGKWPWEIGCHFILKPYLPRWGHRLPSTSNEEPRKWWEAHSREFSLMPCFHRLLIGIHPCSKMEMHEMHPLLLQRWHMLFSFSNNRV